jgi:hypothetical protein
VESEQVRRTWEGDWRARILSRVQSYGYERVSDFLNTFPCEPYVHVVNRLGDDVAAIQVECIQFEEAEKLGCMRAAAVDSLVRDLTWHLKEGWEGGVRGNFNTSGAYVDWLCRLEGVSRNLPPNAHLKRQGLMVWDALEELQLPAGWLPTGPADPFIQTAFARAWPPGNAHQSPQQM